MPKPNLLFIFTDEQRADTLSAYGNTRIQMPNLNRLADESFVFDQAYVTQPVCTPSRASIMTGLYPHSNECTRNNVPLRPEYACLPELLNDPDYATAYHGKWHLGDEIFAQHGFSEWIGTEDAYAGYYGPERDRNTRSDYHHFLVENGIDPGPENTIGRGRAARLPEDIGKPAFLAREASRFIRQNQTQPFVLYVNFLEPHMPFFGPRDDQYDPAEVLLPANFENPLDQTCSLKARLIARHYYEHGMGLPLDTEDGWRRLIANYWGLCSLVDTHVGTILNTLDDCGLRDDTIVVFTSDHGDMMGSHRLLTKTVMYEEATRVPLLLRLPRQRTSRRVHGPVSQVDLVPTLLDLMGAPVPDNTDGKTLRPLLEQPGKLQHDQDVIIEWNGCDGGKKGQDAMVSADLPDWCNVTATDAQAKRAFADAVRTIVTPDGWKFMCSPNGEHELYNLTSDPYETCNLAPDSARLPLMRELTARIRAWQEQTRDTQPLPNIGTA